MLSFASAPGNVFDIIGKCGALVENARSNQNTQLTALRNTTTGLVAQLNNNSDIQALVGSNYIGQLNSIGSIGQLASQVATQALNRLVFNDNPGPNQSLQQLNLTYALDELIRQMKIGGASVLAMVISTSIQQFTSFLSNIGNGVIVASTRRPFDGATLENAFAETLKATCFGDSYSGGATAGNEGFLVTGAGLQPDPFAFDWPLGSGLQSGLSVINGNANNSAGNGLTNSGFETFTGTNTPSNFTLEVGTAGNQFFVENSIVYDPSPSKALRILGDGSTFTSFSQTFNSSTGTTGQLNPQTQYAVNLFLRRDGTAAGTGQMVVELVDSNGTIIQDANGAQNTFSIDLTALSTIYTSFTGVFRTPIVLPSSQKIRLRQTTALSNGRSIYLDKMSMGVMTQLSPSEIFLSIHAGSIPFATNDYAFTTVTNSRGAGGTLDSFQVLFSRLFPQMLTNEFILPSSSTPTVQDSLIG